MFLIKIFLVIDFFFLENEKHLSVVPLIHAFLGWLLYVPWPGIKPSTLAYVDDTLTNWATSPGLLMF